MTNLLFSTFDIPQAAISVAATEPADANGTIEDTQPFWNTIGGERYSFGYLEEGAGNTPICTFNLGNSTTKSVDHLIIARADLLSASGVEHFYIDRSTDGSSWTNVIDVSSFSTLYGPNSHDSLTEATASTAYQYWRYRITGSDEDNGLAIFSKASFGTAFDIGVDVDDYLVKRIAPTPGAWISDAGVEYKNKVGEPQYFFRFVWRGVTDAKAQEFYNEVVRWSRTRPVFLYTPAAGGRHELLDTQRVMHVRVTEFERAIEHTNRNTISAAFTEVLG